MKRGLFFILPLLVLIWGTSLPIANAAGELLSNGDFEEWDSGMPVGWVKDGSVTVNQDAATVRTGTSSVQMIRGSSNQGIAQTVPASSNVPYEFSCWIIAAAAKDGRIRILFRDSGGLTLKTSELRFNATGGVWEQVTTGPVYAPANTAFAYVNIRVYNAAGTTIYLDDASLQEVSLDQISSAFSSEWDATAYNGGRRMVRDSDGIFHMVFHSQLAPGSTPGNPQTTPRASAIFYTHTLRPVIDLPPPIQSMEWSAPVPIAFTDIDGGLDDRHPSIAIEYDSVYPNINNDRIHVVWQKERTPGGVYDISYATLPNEPTGAGTWVGPGGASSFASDYYLYVSNNGVTEVDRNSLVPVVDVSNNFVHVAWQEEDLVDVMGSFYSEILYKVSWDASWANFGAYYRNISESPDTNSQVPSISIAHDDQYNYGYTYPSQTIRIVWNDDFVTTGTAPHIWMATSTDNGFTWDTAPGIGAGTEISLLAGTDGDGYPCIAVEPWNGSGNGGDHIVYMNNVVPADPDDLVLGRIGATYSYDPGVDPSLTNCFPGPDAGMYGNRINRIYYYSVALGVGGYYIGGTATTRDAEFPTICTSGQGLATETKRLWVNYQEYYTTGNNYEIRQETCVLNPAPLATYSEWWSNDETISADDVNDDYFPNLAEKKQGMYWPQGRELAFTKIAGEGRSDAMASAPKSIYYSSSSEWENTKSDINVWHIPTNIEPAPVTMRNPLTSLDTDAAVFIYCGGFPAGTIWSGTLFYRQMDINNGAAWSSSPFNWDSTPGNEYFMASFNINGTFSAGDVVEYYLAMSGDPSNTSPVYLYGDDTTSLRSRMEVVAQGHPFRFTVGAGPTATPTFGYTPTPSPTVPGPSPTPVPTLCTDNLVLNAGFESWSSGPTEAPDDWLEDSSNLDATQESTIVFDGSYATKLYWDSTSNQYFRQYIPVVVGQNYDIRMRYYDNDTGGYIRLYCYWRDSGGGVIGSALDIGSSSDSASWQTWELLNQTAPTGAATFEMTVRCYDISGWSGNATCYVDSAEFCGVAPTATPSPIPTINTWHIPSTQEACNSTTTMRVPENPYDPSLSVWIHTGVFPIGGADTVTVYYRESTTGTWSSFSASHECNYISNDYWGQGIPADTATWTETIEYYILVTKTGMADTYVCWISDASEPTDSLSTAQSNPFSFSYGTQPTATPTSMYSVTPTPVETPIPLINCWHVPDSLEACNTSTTMRVPENPWDPTATTWIHTGVYPSTTASSVTIHYRNSTSGTFSTVASNWECNYSSNDYWGEAIPALTATWGETVQYYLEVQGTGYVTTYVYWPGAVSDTTDTESVAQASPFNFTYPTEPTVTPTPSSTPDYTPAPTPTTSGNLMNVWHIPTNEEPPTVNMRNPVDVTSSTATVYIYVGGYTVENTISSGTLYHREQGATIWNQSTFNYDSTNSNNEYWMASFDIAPAGYDSGDTVEYYLEIAGSGDTTYLYGDDNSSDTTGNASTAQAAPYTFTVLGAIPSTTPFGIGLLLLALGGLLTRFGRKRN